MSKMPSKKLVRAMVGVVSLLAVGSISVQCVSSKKAQKSTGADTEKFVVASPPAEMKKLDINFEDKVTLVGYKLKGKNAVKPGDTVSYTLYWRLDKPLEGKDWKLFTHVFDDQKKRLLNLDQVGPLRKANKGQAGPDSWQVGKIYADEQSFKVPTKTEGRKLSVTVGLWRSKQRLKLKSGPAAGENRATALTLNVAGTAKSAPVPNLRIDKLAKGKAPKIDGKLDEEVWKTAASTGPFVNVTTGAPDAKQKVQGSAKLLWDDTALYVAFNVEDKDVIGGFKAGEKDPHLWTKDCVELMIDPDGNGDNKDYYEIQVNPQNLVFDSRFDSYNLPKGGPNGPFGNQDWSSKIQSAVNISGTLDKSDDEDKGYSVEIKLPWASLDKAKKAPPQLGDEWRLNLYAMQNNGGVGWSPILGQGNFHKASRFGKVLFAEEGWKPLAPKDPANIKSLTAADPAALEAELKKKSAGAATTATGSAPTAPKLTAPVTAKSSAPKTPAPKPAAP